MAQDFLKPLRAWGTQGSIAITWTAVTDKKREAETGSIQNGPAAVVKGKPTRSSALDFPSPARKRKTNLGNGQLLYPIPMIFPGCFRSGSGLEKNSAFFSPENRASRKLDFFVLAQLPDGFHIAIADSLQVAFNLSQEDSDHSPRQRKGKRVDHFHIQPDLVVLEPDGSLGFSLAHSI